MREGVRKEGTQAGSVTNWTQVAAALFVLSVGTLVYVLDRSGESVPFFSAISLSYLHHGVFGPLGGSLPTFAHVFAMSVLTAAWFGGEKQAALPACLVWFGIDTAFEVGQHPQIAGSLVQLIPAWFERLPILGLSDAYFLSGTFDARDLISIVIGATAAYLTIAYTTTRDKRYG